MSKLDRQEDETSNADAFLDLVLIADTVLGDDDEDDDECDDENEFEDEEVKAILLADAILNGPPPNGEKDN